MIKKLQFKFIAVIMTVITVQLVMLLTSLYVSSKVDFYQQSMKEIRTALRDDYPPPKKPGSTNEVGKKLDTPILVVNVTPAGEVRVLEDHLPKVADEEAAELVAMVSDQKKKSGELTSLSLRYSRQKQQDNSVRYVFMDISVEQNALRSQLINSIAIGTLSFAAFLFAAYKISGWMIGPLEKSWDRQREFIADASHELKTPLTVILSNVNLLLDSPADKNSKEFERLEHIQAESVRMKELVEQLLTLARSDSPAEMESYETLDFSYLVQSVLLRFEPIIFDLGKHLTYEIAESLSVSGNRNHLCQMLEIILDNACKYGESGGTIRVHLHQAGPRDVLLSVESTGKPIHKEELKRIFDRFHRTDPSRSQVRGYGLGLSIAASIVSAHSGRIWAESDGISANTFMVRLPQKNGRKCKSTVQAESK